MAETSLILRKCKEDGTSRNNFQWPRTGLVECPDWKPTEECGNGLHGLLWGNGCWGLLDGDLWQVVEVETSTIVDLEDKVKFPKGNVLFTGTLEELRDSQWPSRFKDKLDSKNAYRWARDIGNRDVMIDRVTESQWAYWWASNIGNQDVMIDRVTDPEWAHYWAYFLGNQDVMIDRVTESEWAYWRSSSRK